jgi:hypothetical protein
VTTTPPAPTLTALTTADPCPRVEILITPMPVDVDEITIYRTWAGQRSVVRGASRAEVSGDHLVVDYEAPLGTSIVYTSVGYDSSGIPSEESTGTAVTVAVTDGWLQDPLDPTSAMQVGLTTPRDLMVTVPSFLPASRAMAVTVAGIVGSPTPVGMGGTRQAASGMPLTLDARTPVVAAALEELLDQAYPVCLRTPATLIRQLSGLTYLSIAEYIPTPDDGWDGATLYSMTADTVRGPGAGIVVQPRTYDDLLAEAATYNDLLALYPTYLDMLRGL